MARAGVSTQDAAVSRTTRSPLAAARRPARLGLARSAALLLALGVGGCSCDENIGRLKATIAVEPTQLDFGQVAVNSSKELSLKITNLGSFILSIESFDADPPFIAPTMTATVGTGAQGIEILVGFAPTALGPVSGTLVLTTSDPDAPTVEVPLVGTGIEAAITVTPPVVDFGEVLWNRQTRAQRATVTVTNPGTDAFELTSIELSDDGEGTFTLEPMAVQRVFAAGDTETFEVTFLPRGRGPVSGSVRITNTTRQAPEIVVPLMGTGVGPQMEICAQAGTSAELCTQNGEVPRVDFGLVPLTDTAQGRIRVLNVGERDMRITQAMVTGAAQEFSFTPALAMGMVDIMVPGGMEASWQVGYDPEDYQFDAVIVSFLSDAANPVASSVRVEARVPKATIEVVPRSMTFRLGGAANRSVTPVRLYNCGQEALRITGALNLRFGTGPDRNAFAIENAPAVGTMIQPQGCGPQDPAGASFDVVFSTSTDGNYTASVDIPSNDPLYPVVTVEIGATKN
jgi:hypothetical protein